MTTLFPIAELAMIAAFFAVLGALIADAWDTMRPDPWRSGPRS